MKLLTFLRRYPTEADAGRWFEQGRATDKACVFVAVERGGRVIPRLVPSHTKAALGDAVRAIVYKDATLMTDELPAYTCVGREYAAHHLSRRMNRLVTNAGRRIIEEKLNDLHEQFGIEIEYVTPAYSSQTCSACDYVDKKNRTGERFKCRWCGRTLHADVNASRNLRARRSRPAVGSVKQAKAAVLRAQVLEFQCLSMERWGNPKGRRGTSRDPPTWVAQGFPASRSTIPPPRPCHHRLYSPDVRGSLVICI
jgi:hypothetical protein